MSGGIFVLASVIKLRRTGLAHGVSWLTVGFFSVWGLWNLYYYPHLEQWASLVGGVMVTLANITWVIMLVHFTRSPRP